MRSKSIRRKVPLPSSLTCLLQSPSSCAMISSCSSRPVQVLCKSLAGNVVDLITVTAPVKVSSAPLLAPVPGHLPPRSSGLYALQASPFQCGEYMESYLPVHPSHP